MTNKETVKSINQEITVDLLDDPKLVQRLIDELEAITAKKLGKQETGYIPARLGRKK